MAEWIGAVVDAIKDRIGPLLLCVAGVAFVAAGLFGGLQYQNWAPMPELSWRIAAMVIGLVLIGVGIYFERTNSETLDHKGAAKLGIEFTDPTAGDVVEERCVVVRGKIKKRLPRGYSLWIVRVVPDGWYPSREAQVKQHDKTWEARDVFIGHPTEPQWEMGAYVVGPIGSAAIQLWKSDSAEYWNILERLRAIDGHRDTPARLRPIPFFAFGVVPGHTIKVSRKPSRSRADVGCSSA